MSDAAADAPPTPVKSKKLAVILCLILGIAGAGGGYYAMSSGLLTNKQQEDGHADPANQVKALPDIEYVEIEPIMISLSSSRHIQHLRFRSQLEVEASHLIDVEHIRPRIVDVLNGYLRALEINDLEDPLALPRIRGQLLRRVQVVAGKDRVRDLLIMEFVLN